MSSIEPDGGGYEMNASEEVTCRLVVAGGDCPKLLEFCEEVLNQMPCLVEVAVEVSGDDAVGLRRYDRLLASSGQGFKDPHIGVEGFVGDQCVSLHGRDQLIRADQVVRLSAGQEEADRVAERIDQRMDFRAQSAAGSPDGLVSVFFWAPALC